MKFTRFLILLQLLAVSAFAQVKNYRNEFGFRTDNDAYLAIAQDQYYTNGLFLTFRRAMKQNAGSRFEKKIYEIEAGQQMYNANSGQTDFIQEVDRPFAGYLYAGVRGNWFSKNESVFSASLQLGTIGPAAYGKEVQEGLHHIIGFYDINGWQYQVNNEPAINSSISYSALLGRQEGDDLLFCSFLNVGNTFTGAGAGLLLRTGRLNPVQQSTFFNSRISSSLNDTIPARESFFFVKPALSFVAYNATIQGGMFSQNKGPKTFTPNRLLFSTELGYMYARDRWSFNFSLIFQSKELREQEESHQYGSVSLYYRFN